MWNLRVYKGFSDIYKSRCSWRIWWALSDVWFGNSIGKRWQIIWDHAKLPSSSSKENNRRNQKTRKAPRSPDTTRRVWVHYGSTMSPALDGQTQPLPGSVQHTTPSVFHVCCWTILVETGTEAFMKLSENQSSDHSEGENRSGRDTENVKHTTLKSIHNGPT